MPTPPIRKKHDKGQSDEKKEIASRPLSAFMLFANDVRPRLEMENPSIKAVDLSSKLAESWHDLPEEEKLIYHRRSLELYTRQDPDQKTFRSSRQKEGQKRKAPDRPEHCIIVPNGEMKLIDSPFIQKSKRRRYELPYKYPQSSECQPRPRPPKPQPVKRPPPPRPLIRTYPTYKERIQMMERGLYHKQAPPHIGVFKRSEDNPDLLIVDESGHTTITFPNLERHNAFGSSYSIGPRVSGLNGNSYFHPRIIGNGNHYAQFQLASPSVNFIPQVYPKQFQRFQYPYLTNVHGSYIQTAPQLYQQTVPAQTSVYSEIKCCPVTTGSITVRYEPVTPESFENFEMSDDEYLEHDPFLNINLNDDEIQIDGDEVEFDMMGLDSDQDVKEEEEEEVCDDLDDINPTIAPFEEGIDQYLSLDGQPYVMIPVDIDVAKKLGWPIHMLPSMPKWLSKMTDNEVTSTDVSSTELLDFPKSDSSTQQSGIFNVLDLEKETENAVQTIKIEMPETDIVKEEPETMDYSESIANQSISGDETDSKHDEVGNDIDTELSDNPPINTEDKMPTATGEIMDCCGDKKVDFMATIPDERGDQGRIHFSSTPNQSPLRGESNMKTVIKPSDEKLHINCQSPAYSPIKSVCQDNHLKREKDETQHFKEVIRQEKNFSQNSSNCIVSNCTTTRKPSIILESLLENSDTEIDDTNGTSKDGPGKESKSGHVPYGVGLDVTLGGFMEKQKCSA